MESDEALESQNGFSLGELRQLMIGRAVEEFAQA